MERNSSFSTLIPSHQHPFIIIAGGWSTWNYEPRHQVSPSLTTFRVLGLFGTLKTIVTTQTLCNGNLVAIVDYGAKFTPYLGPPQFGNPLGVMAIRVLGLSGTLVIIVTRQSLCSGIILAIVERGAVATYPYQTKPSHRARSFDFTTRVVSCSGRTNSKRVASVRVSPVH